MMASISLCTFGDKHQPYSRPLEPRATHIWLLAPSALANPILREAALSLLSDEEAARLRRFVFQRDRDTFLATRALSRITLSQCAACDPRALKFAVNRY